MQPDVLIIDEVLAVGDLGFVLKCFKQIDSILPNTAIVFVSHSMPMVSRICNQIILMEKGEAKFQGEDVGKAIDLYYRRFADNDSNVIFSDGSIELQDIKILNVPNILEGMPLLNWGDEFKIKLNFKVNHEIDVPQLIINVFDKEQRPVAIFERNETNENSKRIDGHFEIILSHQNLQLSKGIYSLNITVAEGLSNAPKLRMNSIISFQVTHEQEVWQPFLLNASYEILEDRFAFNEKKY
jgi:lipopolysaccharide transport system ATP-binding protein